MRMKEKMRGKILDECLIESERKILEYFDNPNVILEDGNIVKLSLRYNQLNSL
jgi:hypothetical protein